MKAKIKIKTFSGKKPVDMDIDVEFDKGEYLDIIKEIPKIMKMIKGKIKSEPTVEEVEDDYETITIHDDVYYGHARKGKAFATKWNVNLDMENVSISEADILAGSPKKGDMIAINQNNYDDRWLVASEYFQDNFEL